MKKAKKTERQRHTREEQTSLYKDWRVLLMVFLVIFSVASIYILPPNFTSGPEGNLQLGLDLEGGSWIQLEFQSEVVGFETQKSLDTFFEELSDKLDADIYLISEDPAMVEIRKPYTREEMEQVFSSLGATVTSYRNGVSPMTGDDIKRILEDKINSLGTKDAKINLLTPAGSEFPQYVRIELAGVDMDTAYEIVGKQGKFEIRVQMAGNETDHVLFGDSIKTVGMPIQNPPGSDVWGVSFTLDERGGDMFRDAAISSGAVINPSSHNIMMLLDDNIIYNAPLSSNLASELSSNPVRDLFASTGSGDEGREKAQNLEVHLRAGALPVEVKIAGSGSVPAELGEHFKTMSILAGLFALLTVGIVVYYRYREPNIVLPMIAVNISEIVILLGIARYIQQLDLTAIAGLIAVLGTGIDQLVVITDEVLHEGRVPSPNLYLKRLKRALSIIMVAATTMIIAMLPLALMDLSSLKGFAIVTILGVLIGVLITRPAYGRIIMSILSK